LDKINRMAENFGINEDFAAAVQAHLKAIGEIPDDEPVGADAEGADPVGSPDFMAEENAPEATGWGGWGEVRIFFTPNARNALKSLDSEKAIFLKQLILITFSASMNGLNSN
jgi:hypothetical protein